MIDAPLTIVGDPDGRRTRLLRDAVDRQGGRAPRVIGWEHLIAGTVPRFASHEIVWLDSPDGSRSVDALLRGPGEQSRIADGPRWYRSMCAAAASLRGGLHLTDAADLPVMFDKRACHARLAAAGVPVPDSPTSGGTAPLVDATAVRDAAAAAGLRRYFVKPAHGSSAAGVVAVETASGNRVQARSSVEIASDGRLFNTLRVRKYVGADRVDALLDAVAPETLHVEAWIPKPTVAGCPADLRVVVVAGRATHAVLRLGASTMTNLHLGGRRGELHAAIDGLERSGFGWTRALGVAEAAARCFPHTLCVGVDLLPSVGWRSVRVGEVNAFGDLLPGLRGLPGRAHGLDTYEAQLRALPEWVGDVAA
ncbi:STM4014 family protein [Gordonia hydrophobica]|uniref:STM4014 family protein n=1 Tax=Gordonia hydrophobica TaxID=40516 RepID=A0ABZ2TXR2_9ACTN|nr:STM4014 family protein [Gordonia hydrophobica]MBM7366468.1 glutathione synthase/RimK-type ligase-like ATP-grasp enzyme [Gordonia hydrophobica]